MQVSRPPWRGCGRHCLPGLGICADRLLLAILPAHDALVVLVSTGGNMHLAEHRPQHQQPGPPDCEETAHGQ